MMSEHDNGEKHHVLVVANETIEGRELVDAIGIGADGKATEVLVVAPALNSRLRHWVSDEDRARREAALRLGAYLQELGRHGIEEHGWVGDGDPLLSITDTLHRFSVDEIVIHRLRRKLELAGQKRRRPRAPAVPAANPPRRRRTNSPRSSRGLTRKDRRPTLGVVAWICQPGKGAEFGTFRPQVRPAWTGPTAGRRPLA
jgi:hypothetical protein